MLSFEEIVEYSEGNIGALNFLRMVFHTSDVDMLLLSLPIGDKLRRCTSIRGKHIYILWKDLGDGDIDQVAHICDKVPDDVLEAACQKQDRSGRELIQSYLN